MLPRKSRLNKHNDIIATIRRGKRLDTPYVLLHSLQRNRATTSRFTCIVSKKVHTSATKRHTYQRWLRASAQAIMPRLGKPLDMVWLAKPEIVTIKKASVLQNSLQPYIDQLIKAPTKNKLIR